MTDSTSTHLAHLEFREVVDVNTYQAEGVEARDPPAGAGGAGERGQLNHSLSRSNQKSDDPIQNAIHVGP